MIRRNFFKIAAGAIAALFVPKVAGAITEKPTPFFDPDVLERVAARPYDEGCIYIAKGGLYRLDGNGEWEKLSQGFGEVSDSAWKPKTSTLNIRTIATVDGRMKAGTMTG